MTKENKDFLNLIYRNAEMGRSSLHRLIALCEGERFRDVLKSQYDDYNRVCMSAQTLLGSRGETVKPPVVGNFMAAADIAVSTLVDKSEGHFADMLIKGNERGVKQIDEKLRLYSHGDERIVALAKSLREHLADNTRELKKYLS